MRVNGVLLLFLLPVILLAQEPVRWRMNRSLITFVSEAPLEHITATNTKAAGVVELGTRSFAVQVPVVEFQGFNAPLQREHFNENYMVSTTWPNITFAGRIIESIDLSVPGRYSVRAKGELVVHGVTKERIVPCEVVVTSDGIRVTSNFDVALDEHGIRIPRVVQQKVAPVVNVKVDVLFRSPTAVR
ncbi:MAG: YceI family protein [Flavobacteriales bacterium]|nr:YceI family protein [Flavobacteriales bacterium]